MTCKNIFLTSCRNFEDIKKHSARVKEAKTPWTSASSRVNVIDIVHFVIAVVIVVAIVVAIVVVVASTSFRYHHLDQQSIGAGSDICISLDIKHIVSEAFMTREAIVLTISIARAGTCPRRPLL